ncbi:FYVE, partial [Lamprotornis superbus]
MVLYDNDMSRDNAELSLLMKPDKPPVAPKPKFVLGHKAAPPPVAPKPDIVLSGGIQAARKTKPAIAPKPKVLKSSSIPEVKPPSSTRKSTKSFEEHREDSSQTLDHLNYKNETSEGSTGSTAYILPVSPCKFECLHKLGNGENTCKTQIILEHFDTLENIKLGERNALSLGDSHNEKLASRSQVVLKASILEEKLKDVLTHGVFPNSSPVRRRNSDKFDKGDGSSFKSDVKIEFMELVQSSSSSEVAKGKQQNADDHNSMDEITDDTSMPGAVDKRTDFVRCGTLSMSLPKQLKLASSQHSSAPNSLHVSPQNLENKEVKIKDESSPKVVPKKPQRHGLPAAGLLKKAASAELVDKSSYTSSEDKSNSLLEGSHFAHPRAKEQDALSSCDIPKRSEKPVWKLPHPILPFSGNSESLKTATSFSHLTVVTKPRAKSLSAVDMDRTDKPCKDHHKKNSLKKLLNMKLSVCLKKSDFQKFLSKGSQSVESAIANLPNGDGYGNNRNIGSVGSERKAKSAKAHSVEISSPALQKKRQRNRSQPEMRNNQRLESLERHGLLGENFSQMPLNSVISTCDPEYENVRHYEEIPEYENLPFAMGARRNLCSEWQNSSSVEDQSNDFYEVEEPCEATSRHWRLDSCGAAGRPLPALRPCQCGKLHAEEAKLALHICHRLWPFSPASN